jgi:hypothetical protein
LGEKLYKLGAWMRGGLFIAALAVVSAAAKLSAVAVNQETRLAAAGFALLGLSFVGIISIALRHVVRELCAVNNEAAQFAERRRALRRTMSFWKKLQVRWDDTDNAARGQFDAAVESLLRNGEIAAARGLAVEKLHVAHSAGEREHERMYRRYVKVLDRMGEAA